LVEHKGEEVSSKLMKVSKWHTTEQECKELKPLFSGSSCSQLLFLFLTCSENSTKKKKNSIWDFHFGLVCLLGL